MAVTGRSSGRQQDPGFGKIAGELQQAAFHMGQLAVAGVAVGSVVGSFRELERQLVLTNSVAQGNAAQFKNMEKAVRSFALVSTFSAAEAANSLYFLASAGFSVEESLSAMTGVLTLAQATLSNVNESAELVASSIKAFNLEAAEAGRVANTFVAAITRSQATLPKLAFAFRQVAPVAGAAGIEIETVVASLGALFNVGLRGEQAGTALRNIVVSLIDPAGDAARIIEVLGLETKNADGSLRDLFDILTDLADEDLADADLARLFGREALAGAIAALNAIKSGNLQNLKDEITGTSDASRIALQQLDSLDGAFKIFNNSVTELRITLGQGLSPVLETVLNLASDLVIAFTGLDAPTKSLLSQIGSLTFAGVALVAVIGPIGAGLAFMGKRVLAIVGLFKSAAASVVLLTVAFKAFAPTATIASTASVVFRGGIFALMGPIAGVIGILGSLVFAIKSVASAFNNAKLDERFGEVPDFASALGREGTQLNRLIATGEVEGVKTLDGINAIAEQNRKVSNALDFTREKRQEIEDKLQSAKQTFGSSFGIKEALLPFLALGSGEAREATALSERLKAIEKEEEDLLSLMNRNTRAFSEERIPAALNLIKDNFKTRFTNPKSLAAIDELFSPENSFIKVIEKHIQSTVNAGDTVTLDDLFTNTVAFSGLDPEEIGKAIAVKLPVFLDKLGKSIDSAQRSFNVDAAKFAAELSNDPDATFAATMKSVTESLLADQQNLISQLEQNNSAELEGILVIGKPLENVLSGQAFVEAFGGIDTSAGRRKLIEITSDAELFNETAKDLLGDLLKGTGEDAGRIIADDNLETPLKRVRDFLLSAARKSEMEALAKAKEADETRQLEILDRSEFNRDLQRAIEDFRFDSRTLNLGTLSGKEGLSGLFVTEHNELQVGLGRELENIESQLERAVLQKDITNKAKIKLMEQYTALFEVRGDLAGAALQRTQDDRRRDIEHAFAQTTADLDLTEAQRNLELSIAKVDTTGIASSLFSEEKTALQKKFIEQQHEINTTFDEQARRAGIGTAAEKSINDERERALALLEELHTQNLVHAQSEESIAQRRRESIDIAIDRTIALKTETGTFFEGFVIAAAAAENAQETFLQAGQAFYNTVEQSITSTTADLIANIGNVETSFSEILSNMFRDWARFLAKLAAQRLFTAIIGSLIPGGGSLTSFLGAANGGTFNNLQAFAKGGLIDKPTMFNHTGGMALAGEAGTEAIMPLARDSKGRLGVSGGSGGNLTIATEVNVSTGEGSGGTPSNPKDSQKLSQMIQQEVRKTVIDVITDQKRSGGLLNKAS